MYSLVILLIVGFYTSEIYGFDEEKQVFLKADHPQILSITKSQVYRLQINLENGRPTNARYITCQIHSQYKNVTLSLTKNFTLSTSKTGTDVGVVSKISDKQFIVTWFLFQNLSSAFKVMAVASIVYSEDPVPGGCNLEFNLELDPNLLLHYYDEATVLEYQYANVAFNETALSSCESSTVQSQMNYQLYVYYIKGDDFTEETYFSALEAMLTPHQVKRNGKKLVKDTYSDSGKPDWVVSSYRGQGVVYTALAERSFRGQTYTTSYIPAVTYACDLNLLDSNCKHIDAGWIVLAIVSGIIGVFLSFLGHRFFKTGNFIFAFLAFSICLYIVIVVFSETSSVVTMVLVCILSLVGACLWLSVWYCCGIPSLSVLLSGLVAGYLLSSIIFYTPFGNLYYWSKDFNYGMAFTCGVLVAPVLLLAFTKTLNIVACSFVGSYLIIMPIDVFLHAGMKGILLNSLRHATNKNYFSTIVTGPFNTTEIALTTAWTVLFLVAVVIQFLRERGRPDFPESPRQVRAASRADRESRPVPWRQRITNDDDDEYTPLIRDQPPQGYTSNQAINKTLGDVDTYQRNEPR